MTNDKGNVNFKIQNNSSNICTSVERKAKTNAKECQTRKETMQSNGKIISFHIGFV